MRRNWLWTLLPMIVPSGLMFGGEVVYESKWVKPGAPGEEWKTEQLVEFCPNGSRLYLAGINGVHGGTELRLADLPDHEVVRIDFDLVLRGTWAGSSKNYGPDRAIVVLDGTRTIMDASFRTDESEGGHQSFPHDWDSGLEVRGTTGAAESNSLGYYWICNGKVRFDDAVYRLSMTVPHRGKTLKLRWSAGLNVHRTGEQSYGIDKVRVTAIAKKSEFTDDEWAQLVRQLKGKDVLAAERAMWRMLECPPRVGEFLEEVELEGDLEKLRRLVKELGAEEFQARQNAADRLLNQPRSAIAALESLLEEEEDDEIQARGRRIVRELEKAPAAPSPVEAWKKRLRTISGEGREEVEDTLE